MNIPIPTGACIKIEKSLSWARSSILCIAVVFTGEWIRHLTSFFFSGRRRHTISLRDWSSDVCSSDLPNLESFATLGLTRGGRGLGLAFDPGEPGEAKVKIGKVGLEALSDWLPARPLRPAGDRSEERRVGKECRSRWSPGPAKDERLTA